MRTLIMLAVCLLAAIPQAWAASTDLKPSQIFAADSPSIVVVVAYGQDGKPIAQGSGVVIAKDTVVSNCHVIEKADTAGVLYQSKRFAATLRYEDIERDLCSFTVKGLSAPPVSMGSTSQVQVGDAAYAIGAPEGLDLTLSGGLISSLRKIPDGVVLQMTTPISPGSSGGGLFDSQGRLIGITSYYMKGGEQLNFALPVEWVRGLPQRGKLASANVSRTTHAPNLAQKSNLQEGIRAWAAGDYTAALAILKPLAMRGNAAGQYFLGTMYANGQGVSQDYAEAIAWIRKAAAQGNADAQNDLGVMYGYGQGIPQDYAQAGAWYRKAAAQGVAAAQYNLGLMYANGWDKSQDYTKAVYWYRKAAEQGYADAQYNLGTLYHDGQGVPQDYSQADYWFRKAAEQGYAAAQSNLGVMYANGWGVPQDYTQAVYWFRKAAIQGEVEGLLKLGAMYFLGRGVAQDYVAAYALSNLAAAHDSSGNTQAEAIRSIVNKYMTPEQVEAAQALTREMQRIGAIKALDEYLNGGAH